VGPGHGIEEEKTSEHMDLVHAQKEATYEEERKRKRRRKEEENCPRMGSAIAVCYSMVYWLYQYSLCIRHGTAVLKQMAHLYLYQEHEEEGKGKKIYVSVFVYVVL